MENENFQKKSFAEQSRGIFQINYMWAIIQMYFSSKKFVAYEIKYVNFLSILNFKLHYNSQTILSPIFLKIVYFFVISSSNRKHLFIFCFFEQNTHFFFLFLWTESIYSFVFEKDIFFSDRQSCPAHSFRLEPDGRCNSNFCCKRTLMESARYYICVPW